MEGQKVTNMKVASPFSPYTLEVKRVGPYVFRRIVRMPISKVNEFCALVAKFIRKSNEWDATVQQTIRKIELLIATKPDDTCWYVIEQDSRMVGYFYAEVMIGEYEGVSCHVHQVFVSPRTRYAKLPKEIESILVDFGRRRGALSLDFLTTRSPEAFIRNLAGKWTTQAIQLKREI